MYPSPLIIVCLSVALLSLLPGRDAAAWSYSIALYHHPNFEGESKAFGGIKVPERVTFNRCFGWTSSARYVVNSEAGICLCFSHGRDGSGLTRCFDELKGEGEIKDFTKLAIDNFPRSFTVLNPGADDCIGVPHFPVRSTTNVRSGC